MLIQGDVSALEWRCAAFLSQDKVAYQEIWDEIDQHTDNQTRFGLPSRLIAKKFVFRLIYGGSAYSYANDPDFSECKMSEKQWQKVIEEFYSKYKGLSAWHTKIVQDVTLTGKLILPTGREYHYSPTTKRGELVWPRTTILNYPVQGLGADLMAIARVALWTRLKALQLPQVKMVNTVHDSIILDSPDEYTDLLAQMMLDVFRAVPRNFQKLFGVEFNIPIESEIEVGKDWGSMSEWKTT